LKITIHPNISKNS